MKALVLAMMLALSKGWGPLVTYDATAEAIGRVVTEDPPLFEGEDGRKRTAALLVAIAFSESGLRPDAIGDHGEAMGLYQVHTRYAPHDWRDPVAATREALRLVRVSFRACAALPVEEKLAAFASGSCNSSAGRRLSRYRFALAKRLARIRLGDVAPYPSQLDEPNR